MNDCMAKGCFPSAGGWTAAVLVAFAYSAVLAQETAPSPSQQVRQQIAQAAATEEPNAMSSMLDAAVAAAEGLARELDRPDTPAEGRLEIFRINLLQAEAIGFLRPRSSQMRLRYLQGTEQDRKTVGASAEKAGRLLEDLTARIDAALVQWRRDYKLLATAVPELEDLREAVAGKLAWAAYYRALGCQQEAERLGWLRQAVERAGLLIREGRDTSARGGLLFLRGEAQRHGGQFDAATEDLLAAAEPNAPIDMRADAVFELACNLVEQGRSLAAEPATPAEAATQVDKKFHQATKAVEAYEKLTAATAADATSADAKATLLRKYLHDTAAACRRDPAAASADRNASNEAAIAFLARHADIRVQRAFLAVVARDARGRADQRNSDSLTLLALVGGEGSDANAQDRRAMLEAILVRSDDLSVRLRPLANWHLAFLAADSGDDQAAGEAFSQLATRYPADALAPQAAVQAAACYRRAVAACQSSGAAPDLRRRFIAAIELLLDRRANPDPAGAWRLELGWQYEKLTAQVAEGEKAALTAKAIAAYQAVPSQSPRYLQARWRRLELSRGQLPPGKDSAAWRLAAMTLVNECRAYASDAAVAAKAPPEGLSAAEILNWGAGAEILAAELLYDLPPRRQEAMAILRDLPARWPGAPALAEAAEFQIRKLLEQGLIDQAALGVETFARSYPDQAARLIQMVVAQLRRRMDVLRAYGQAKDRSGDLRGDFLRLAGTLYQPLAGRPMAQRGEVTQMYAEALLENSRAGEALPLLLECEKYAQAARLAGRGAIDRQCQTDLAAVKAAGGDVAKLRAMARSYLAGLAELGIRPEDSRYGQTIRIALEAASGDKAAVDAAALARALEEGLPALAEMRKTAVSVDAANLAALARAYRALGRYDEAVERYHALLEGMGGGSPAYWTMELEYCQCLLEGFSSDGPAMKALTVRIRQLAMEDASLGGLKDRFDAVAKRAGELAGG